jgi:hypothetical protein
MYGIEEFEDTKGVIRKIDNTMTKRKRISNEIQNITQKTKDLATRTSLKIGGEIRCFGRVCSSWSTRTSFYSSYKPVDNS